MADFQIENIEYYNGTPTPFSGSTSFGYFDEDVQLQTDAPKLLNHICQQLGYPVNDIEITNNEIYDCIELALMDFSYHINEFRTEENYFELLGQSSGTDFTNKLIFPSLQSVIRLSEAYNIEAGVPSEIEMMTGNLDVERNKSVYNLKSEFLNIVHPEEKRFTIHRVFHSRIPAARAFMNTQFNYPINGVGNVTVADGYFYTLMPFGWDVSRMQGINTHRDLRLSEYSFEIKGDTIRLSPIPVNPYKLFFHYTLGSEEEGAIKNEDSIYNQLGLIVKPSDVNFGLISWQNLNSQYRTWIIKYSTELSRKKLGINRRKFGSVDYPSGTVQLDGDTLVSEATGSIEMMQQNLKESLMKLSKDVALTTKANMLQNQKQIYNGVPLGIYRV